MCRVKFYSIGDWSSGDELIKLESKLKCFDKNKTDFDINEITEFFNINKYIENEVYLKSWDIDFINSLKDYNKVLKRIIGIFLSGISNLNILSIYKQCDIEYKEDFWELIETFSVYKRIDSNTLENLLQEEAVSIYQLLKHQKLVEYYGESIKKYLINESSSAEIILDKYVMENRDRNNIVIPKELTLIDKETIMVKFINSNNPNINYLEAISKVRGNDNFRVSDTIKLQARRRLKKEQDKLFDKSTGIRRDFSVICSKEIEEDVKYSYVNDKYEFIYSFKWIEENEDYNTLLNNFIFLFEFVDSNIRISLMSKKSEMSIIEKTFSTSSRDSYKIGFLFNSKHYLSIMQIQSYYEVLMSIGIRLEEIIKWFFEEYLLREFEMENFVINMPSDNTSFFEKCRFILPEMEFILKQYYTYVSDGYIDQEVLQISSNHLIYKDIPSLISRKYAYPFGSEFDIVTYYLFSDQCMLSYIKRLDEKYKTFYELLMNEDIYISDYNNRFISDLNWLKDNNYIIVNSIGKIEFSEINKIIVLKDLYMNEFINYNRYPKNFRDIIDDMNIKGMIKFEDKLFSKQESDYFNYYLNKSTFDNSLDLRNMYSHGTQPNPDDNFHKNNYFVFLRLLVLIIIKINDELLLRILLINYENGFDILEKNNQKNL